MNRRGFFGTLLAPLIAKYLPSLAPLPVEENWWDALNVAASQWLSEIEK